MKGLDLANIYKEESAIPKAPKESRPSMCENGEEARETIGKLLILSTTVSYTVLAARMSCENEFLHLEEKILKLSPRGEDIEATERLGGFLRKGPSKFEGERRDST
ncbi:unnamed protein product [Ilex paraguariensis]|uniref:Uncharacterized protein n=1 Tax=Ilex paraguariensis TaxID=185542 RepID=A0ABC8T768_9AQUA